MHKYLSKIYPFPTFETKIINVRFNWVFTFFSSWIIWGYYLDLRDHASSRILNESFLSPWHIFVYIGVAGLGMYFFYALRINRSMGSRLPSGYILSFLGILSLAVGGFLDLLWHTFIGVEKGLELFVSPPHVLISISTFLIVSGPLRNLLVTKKDGLNFVSFLPAIISTSYIFSVLTFMTLHTHPFFQIYAGERYWRDAFQNQDRAIYFILIQSAILVGIIFSSLKLGRLPFGTFTLILGINAILMCLLRGHYKFLPGVFLSGLFIDLLYKKLRIFKLVNLHIFGFLASFIYFCFYFLILLGSGSLIWPTHLWVGTIIMSGITGLLVSYLTTAFLPRDT